MRGAVRGGDVPMEARSRLEVPRDDWERREAVSTEEVTSETIDAWDGARRELRLVTDESGGMDGIGGSGLEIGGSLGGYRL